MTNEWTQSLVVTLNGRLKTEDDYFIRTIFSTQDLFVGFSRVRKETVHLYDIFFVKIWWALAVNKWCYEMFWNSFNRRCEKTMERSTGGVTFSSSRFSTYLTTVLLGSGEAQFHFPVETANMSDGRICLLFFFGLPFADTCLLFFPAWWRWGQAITMWKILSASVKLSDDDGDVY